MRIEARRFLSDAYYGISAVCRIFGLGSIRHADFGVELDLGLLSGKITVAGKKTDAKYREKSSGNRFLKGV